MEAIDSDYEMVFAALMEEKADVAAVDNDEHLMVLPCNLAM
jgi:hypothetical protein